MSQTKPPFTSWVWRSLNPSVPAGSGLEILCQEDPCHPGGWEVCGGATSPVIRKDLKLSLLRWS